MKSKSVAIIDYGMGNLHSAAKALMHVSPETRVLVTQDRTEILSCDHVIVPGVGAMRDCMAEIRRTGADEIIREAVKEKPVLGICVGMQALMESSEENGGVECLGLLEGKVLHFGDISDEHGTALKVPHMGWNNVYQREAHPLWTDIEDGERFYFVHSYYVACRNEAQVAGTCTYGLPFDAVVFRDNLVATQFHPEKSSAAGLQLLQNFLNWDGSL